MRRRRTWPGRQAGEQPGSDCTARRSGRVTAVASARRQTLLAYFQAVDANDLDQALATFDDEVVYERPGYPALLGIGSLRRFYEEERVIARGRHTIEGLVIEGEDGAAWGRFEGFSWRGEPLAEWWSDVYRFKDDRIVFRRSHFFRPAI
jgi:ketosteroid isomerase-like protein